MGITRSIQIVLRLYELHYNLGHVLHQQGDLAGAVAQYRHTLALHPDYVNAHHSLGVALDQQGKREAAVQHYRQAIALQPSYLKAYNNLGCTLIYLNRLEEAVQIYQQALLLQPDWAVLHNNLGQALLDRDPVAAIAAYRQAIALQPDYDLAHYNLGKALQSQGQHREAIACFQRVRTSDQNYVLALSDRGLSWLRLGQPEKALRDFQQALDPQLPLIQAYCEWATQLKQDQADELTQARTACAEFLQGLCQGATAVTEALVQTYWHLGNVLLAYGGETQYRQAEKYYQQALHLRPDQVQIYLKLADCLTRQSRFNAALLVCHTALAMHPQHPQGLAQVGYLLEQQQQWERAIAYYQQALVQFVSEPIEPINLQSDCAVRSAMLQVQERCLSHPGVSSSSGNRPQGYTTTHRWISQSLSGAQDLQAQDLQAQYLTVPPDRLTPSWLELTFADEQHFAYEKDTADKQNAAPCGGLNCSSCLQRIHSHFGVTHLGNGIYRCNGISDAGENDGQGTFCHSAPFTAILPQGKAWAMPQQNSWQICNAIAILTPDNQLLADVSRDYPGQLPGCTQIDPARHQIFAQTELPEPEPIEGAIVALAGLSGHNYFHWMVDILPRLEILRCSGVEFSQIDRFWINFTDQPFQRATLQHLGIPAEKILSSDRHPHIQADPLIVPAFAGYLGWPTPWAIEFLRREFLSLDRLKSALLPGESIPRRIYISRARASHRRVLNETAVTQYLQSFGFVTVALEELSFAEQVTLFAQAEVIIAPHGGGLTNIVFCRPGTVVVELVSPHYIRQYYWVISDTLKLQHYFVVGEAITCYPIRQLMYPSPLTEDIWVDLESLQKLVQNINLEVGCPIPC